MATHKQKERKQGASRRDFLKVAGAGTAAATFGALTLSAKEAQAQTFDAEYDIVVCGGGGAGLPVALFSRWLGNKVVVLEKAATLGGTSFKAAYWYWVPNNAAMRKAGIPDRQAALPALRRATEPAAELRSQSSALWAFRVGIQHVRGHLRQLVGGHGIAVGERRTAVSARSPGAGLLRGNGDHRRDRPRAVSQGRRALHVRRRAGGDAHFVHGVPA